MEELECVEEREADKSGGKYESIALPAGNAHTFTTAVPACEVGAEVNEVESTVAAARGGRSKREIVNKLSASRSES